MRRRLQSEGWSDVVAVNLRPNDGSASLVELAGQVRDAAEALRSRVKASAIDVIGFSMGALVSRYWLQRLDGREVARRFISISGPHHGTLTAYVSGAPGIAEMRPNSRFLQALGDDPAPWGGTEVHAYWTPLDLIIVPPRSSVLPGATLRTFPVLLHPLMLSDRRVLDAVVATLRAPERPVEAPSTAEAKSA